MKATNTHRAGYLFALAAVVALTLFGGILHGQLRNRWGPSEAMQAAAQKLGEVPDKFGGSNGDTWQMKSSETLEPGVVEMLECTGYFVRTYENRRTGESVNVFVVVGPTGPISVHTPEICYSTRNYSSRDNRQRIAIQGAREQDDQFWALTFKTKAVREDILRVYYGWSTDGKWTAPDDPRYAFVGSPYLYKIQLSSIMPAGSNLKNSDTCHEFLRDFVPALRPYLIGASKQ